MQPSSNIPQVQGAHDALLRLNYQLLHRLSVDIYGPGIYLKGWEEDGRYYHGIFRSGSVLWQLGGDNETEALINAIGYLERLAASLG